MILGGSELIDQTLHVLTSLKSWRVDSSQTKRLGAAHAFFFQPKLFIRLGQKDQTFVNLYADWQIKAQWPGLLGTYANSFTEKEQQNDQQGVTKQCSSCIALSINSV